VTLEDETLLFESRLDAYALTVAGRMSVQLTALLAEVEAILRRSGQAPLSRRELAAVQALLASRSGIAEALAVQTTALQREAAELGPKALARALKPSASQLAQALAQARRAALAVTLGDATPAFYARKLYRDLAVQLTARLAQSVALGESSLAFLIRSRELGDKVRAEAETLARSTATATAHAVKTQSLDKLAPNRVVAYRYVAVLDNRTSRMCQGLSGSVWRADRKADLERIKPPRHPNCRSSLVPLTQSEFDALKARADQEARLDINALNKAVDEGRTLASDRTAQDTAQALRALGRGAPGDFRLLPDFRVAGYDDWLSRQSESVQREILGPARLVAWRRGVPLSRLGTFARPLKLEELRRLYPDEFTGAVAA
jgi:SPP1 gp7 family putative phage head morphogenesis protein